MNVKQLVIGAIAIASTVSFDTALSQDKIRLDPSSPKLNSSNSQYYDIGGFHREVTTTSTEAQLWFDRGLAMCYGFNHEEAVRCFKKALAADSSLAMGYWGLAYALGPNINNMDIEAHKIAQAELALELAKLHADSCTDVEKGLLSALANRYTTPVPDVDDRGPLNQAYADAMRTLAQKHPDNSMVTVLLAESLMLLRPWKHWTKDGQPAEETPEIMAALEAGLKKWPNHPALCHLYIHTMEASPHPERALPAANRLRNAMPGSGHLVHMPSHIDVLLGDYQSAIETNLRAIEVDKQFVKREGKINFYTLYRVHNHHFVVYGAMFDGQRDLAMKTARELVRQIPPEMLAAQTDFLDAFMPMPLHVMIRFGQWEQILAEPKPAAELPMSVATWHYARSLALAATGRVKRAEKEQAAFTAAKSNVPDTSLLFQNKSLDILGVAEAMIAGEIAYRKGDYQSAFKHLREAVERDDNLNYDEPWGWMQPARHALGALLLEQKRFAEAEKTYRQDLQRRPANAWSLYGLADALRGQGKTAEADKTMKQFRAVSKRSDIKIDRSCFCKNQDLADAGKVLQKN